jgi:hypothetical protein
MVLALLGAYHGLNPGMGWLFAVARGLQEGSRTIVLRSFAPIAVGHMASVALVVALVALAQPWINTAALQLAGCIALVLFGSYKLVIRKHPRWVGMRVGARELVAWSFLMATAHGAGLMLIPVLLQLPVDNAHAAHVAAVIPASSPPMVGHDHMAHHSAPPTATALNAQLTGLAAVAVHTVAMFVVMAGVALLVYEKLGLAVLRRAWFNLDLLWAGSLIAAGLLSLPWGTV